MADVKISELAKTVGVSVDKLLAQIKEAGLPHLQPDELISNDDKNALLVFLRRSHGDREATNAAPKKITLKRKTIGTLKSSSNHGRGKTVNVEVRKKRTYVKRVAEENLDSASTTQEDEENLEKPIPETQEVKSEPKGETKDGEDVAKEPEHLGDSQPVESKPPVLPTEVVPPEEVTAARTSKSATKRKPV